MTSHTLPYSIAQMVRDRAEELGDNPVFSYEDTHLSYAELNANSNRTANALIDQDIGRGSRIAFLGKNSPAYFELIAAAAKIGAVIVPINWRLAGPELVYVLNDCETNLIFVEAEFYQSISEIFPLLEHEQQVILTRGELSGDNLSKLDSYPEWQSRHPDSDPKLDRSADDDVVQLYTSGTTGNPKGAVLTGRMLLALRGQGEHDVVEDWQRYKEGESGLLAMPCFHVGGTSFGLGIIFSAAHAVVLREYDPNQVLELIEQYSVGKIFMVPAALQILMSNPKINTVELSSLKHIYYGASPIPLDLMKDAMDRFGCGFVQMYGMTESGGTIVALPPEDHDPNFNEKMNSVGKPLSGVELKVLDEQGQTLPSGAIGEIATRSIKNIKRYWNLPEMTEEAIDSDGWLRTGDAGYLDDDGYLYIQDRVKDMIITGGENVYPAEVENAVFSHESVDEVAVIGIPDETWGEAVKAIIVLKEGEVCDEQAIISFARSRIASYKCPKSVDFIDALPRNASGKILRRELREPYWKDKSKAVN